MKKNNENEKRRDLEIFNKSLIETVANLDDEQLDAFMTFACKVADDIKMQKANKKERIHLKYDKALDDEERGATSLAVYFLKKYHKVRYL